MLITKKFLCFKYILRDFDLKKYNYIHVLTSNPSIIVYSQHTTFYNLFAEKTNLLDNYVNIIFKSLAKFQHILFLYYQLSTLSLLKNNSLGLNLITLPKKIKKITILRAPCNHKNSKEQYGKVMYKSIISFKLN
jgi:hypothetical protein